MPLLLQPAAPLRLHCLEWLPAATDPYAPQHSSTHNPHTRRPLVVILPWMWAAQSAVARHVALYHSLGCDVAVFRGWPSLAVWLPLLARRNGSILLTALADHLRDQGPRDVILACFSGAAKGVLCPLLGRLMPAAAAAAAAEVAATATAAARNAAEAAQTGAAEALAEPAASAAAAAAASNPLGSLLSRLPSVVAAPLRCRRGNCPPLPPPPPDPPATLLLRHLRGVLFDSGPVDFDSSVGVRLFANGRIPAVRRLQAAAGAAAAGALDFCLYEVFEAQRRAMWVALRRCLAAAAMPVLFLYSWSGDTLADPQPIHALALALRAASEVAAAPGPEEGAAVPAAAVRTPAAMEAGTRAFGAARGPCCGGGGGGAAAAAAVPRVGSWPALRSGGSSDSGNSSSMSNSADDTGAHDTDRQPQQRSHPPAEASDGGSRTAATARTPPLSPRQPSAVAAAAADVGIAPRPAPVRVWEQGWSSSPHVAHLRAHPDQYRQVVAAFLNTCLQTGPPAAPGAAAWPSPAPPPQVVSSL